VEQILGSLCPTNPMSFAGCKSTSMFLTWEQEKKKGNFKEHFNETLSQVSKQTFKSYFQIVSANQYIH
jgi:hypothetical protein